MDESYFGGHRKGKRGRGAAGKIIVFGLLKSGGKVFTVPVANTKTATLLPIIRQKIKPDSVEFVKNHSHINEIENFWSQAKRHLRKYNGIPKQHFELFLKECEWRFNGGSPKQLLEDLKTILKN